MRDDVDTQATFKALRKWKKTEFGRRWRETPFDIRGKLDTALEGCVWERARGLPDRWPSVLELLRQGHSLPEIFPDLYDKNGHNRFSAARLAQAEAEYN